MNKYELHLGDCLEVMKSIPDGSIDLILCDLPYGTTQNKWDSIIPLDKIWNEYNRVCSGAVVLTASQPFTSFLVTSNIDNFKYQWVWNKSKVTGVLNAKRQPLRNHEDICVFYQKQPTYNPQGVVNCNIQSSTGVSSGKSSSNYGAIRKTESGKYTQKQTGYPRSVLAIASEGKTVHPTQKPLALMEYLIKTYTNEGDLVLDNCMGSGTTGVACMNTGRRFIGIEKDAGYFQVAQGRIMEAADTNEQETNHTSTTAK